MAGYYDTYECSNTTKPKNTEPDAEVDQDLNEIEVYCDSELYPFAYLEKDECWVYKLVVNGCKGLNMDLILNSTKIHLIGLQMFLHKHPAFYKKNERYLIEIEETNQTIMMYNDGSIYYRQKLYNGEKCKYLFNLHKVNHEDIMDFYNLLKNVKWFLLKNQDNNE